MEVATFLQNAEREQSLADYLDSIAQIAAPEDSYRTSGLDFLFFVAAYGLFKVLQHRLDLSNRYHEVTLRRLMEEEIDVLVARGHTQKESLAAVIAVSKAVSIRPPDESIIRAGLALLSKSKTG